MAILTYSGGHRVTISSQLRGCNQVSNGTVVRIAAGMGSPPAYGPQLIAQLERLTGDNDWNHWFRSRAS